MRKFPLLILLFTFVLTGCAAQEDNHGSAEHLFLSTAANLQAAKLQNGEALKVVATTNIVSDIAGNIGGEFIELEALIPRGADPHAYEPSPGDLRKLTDADLVLINGVELEEPLHATFAEISGDTSIVSLSQGLQLQSFADTQDARHEEDDDDHDHGGFDPHVWLDPLNVQLWVANAADTLSALDPENADIYRSNAAEYSQELADLNIWIEQQLAAIPSDQRKLVTDHRALGYFATRYQFELVATVIPAYSTAAEPSARELGQLIDTIENESVQAIFVSSTINTTLAERIAEDTGIKIVPLFIGTLGSADGPAGNYIGMMNYNVEAIKTALSQPSKSGVD